MTTREKVSVMIRAATAGDADALASLLSNLGYPASPDEVPGRLERVAGPDHAVLLATDSSGSVVGLVGMHSFPVVHAERPTCYITALAIAPEARGRGVGRRLVAAAEGWATERGCSRLTVTSAEYRAEAHAFYPACGLPYTGRRFSKVLAPSIDGSGGERHRGTA